MAGRSFPPEITSAPLEQKLKTVCMGALAMVSLPVYIPHPKVCHMEQYHCCKHWQNCRLYPVCSQIQKPSVCQRDCPTCTYEGCSLTAAQRKEHPVYVAHVIQGDRIDLDLESRYLREQSSHREAHRKKYVFYNTLFGDYSKRRNTQQRARYWKDPDHYRRLARESYARRYIKKPEKAPNERLMPECGLKCAQCPYDDCILPADWKKKAWFKKFQQDNPDYFKQYREAHREERKEYSRQYYQQNKAAILERQKQHRQKPEVKAQRAEYDRKYQKAHPESLKRRKKKYRDTHPERVRAYKKAYWDAHKEEINAKRRGKNHGSARSIENPAHSQV